MEKKELEGYIEKLKHYEELFSSEEIDETFFKGVDSLTEEISKKMSTETMAYRLPVGIKKLHKNAVIPTYSNDGDAGLDLVVTEIKKETNESISYGFGLSVEIPYGYVGLLFPRSSIRTKGLVLSNSVGVIDSSYRGELMATFKKTNQKITHTVGNSIIVPVQLNEQYLVGERAAQLIIIPYPQIQFIEKDELSTTERGEGGYGSTGK